MIDRVTVTADLTNLRSIQGRMRVRVGQGITATVRGLQQRAQENSRVDTGAQSISVGARSTPNVGIVPDVGVNDYEQRMSAVRELNPQAHTWPAPDLPAVGADVYFAAVVQCGVEYGIYNDQGAAGRSGDGWFTRAAEEARDRLGANVDRELQRP